MANKQTAKTKAKRLKQAGLQRCESWVKTGSGALLCPSEPAYTYGSRNRHRLNVQRLHLKRKRTVFAPTFICSCGYEGHLADPHRCIIYIGPEGSCKATSDDLDVISELGCNAFKKLI